MNAIVNTKGQERAAWAWQAIEEAVRELGGKKAENYGLLVKKLPSWLQVGGLGQTMAFLFSKSKKGPYGLLFTQLSKRIGVLVGTKNRAEGMKLITEMSPSDYRRVTYQLMRTAELLKRFADGGFILKLPNSARRLIMAALPSFPQRSGSSRKDGDAVDLCLPLPVQTAQLILQQQQLYGSERVTENLGLWLDRLIPVNRNDQEPWGVACGLPDRWLCPPSANPTVQYWFPRADPPAGSREVSSLSRTEPSLESKTTGSLLTDAGRAHTLSTSLSFHPMWGVPRIAGSAIKGAVRSLAEAEGARLLVVALGTQEKSSQIVFYDALPVDGKFTLALDVVTPHFGDYYTGKAPPPNDPIPHTFLTVVELPSSSGLPSSPIRNTPTATVRFLMRPKKYLELVLRLNGA